MVYLFSQKAAERLALRNAVRISGVVIRILMKAGVKRDRRAVRRALLVQNFRMLHIFERALRKLRAGLKVCKQAAVF